MPSNPIPLTAMFEFYQDDNWFSVPPVHGYAYTTFYAPSGYVLISLGWQNEGNATDLYASQLVIFPDGASGYAQIVNTSTTGTNIKFSCVYGLASGNTDAAKTSGTAPKPVLKTQIGEGKS